MINAFVGFDLGKEPSKTFVRYIRVDTGEDVTETTAAIHDANGRTLALTEYEVVAEGGNDG